MGVNENDLSSEMARVILANEKALVDYVTLYIEKILDKTRSEGKISPKISAESG